MSIESLQELAEPLLALSLSHLHPCTRRKLRTNALSVNTYPTEFGGLVYIGLPRHRVPTESDLAQITMAAERAGIHWLLFDAESPVVDGLPVFEPHEPMT